jgi:hypothetical protein
MVMTDEERERLCEELRTPRFFRGYNKRLPAAAEEIERLARENKAQAAEIDWLRNRINYAHLENTHANTPG